MPKTHPKSVPPRRANKIDGLSNWAKPAPKAAKISIGVRQNWAQRNRCRKDSASQNFSFIGLEMRSRNQLTRIIQEITLEEQASPASANGLILVALGIANARFQIDSSEICHLQFVIP
jgi:hypothetical protein